MDGPVMPRPPISGVAVLNCLLDLSAHCRTHQMRVTHFRVTQEQFDALSEFMGYDWRFIKTPTVDGYPLVVYP